MRLAEFLARADAIMQITLLAVQGSTPRDVGTDMFVTKDALYGTIGGGQLEYLAIDHARHMLSDGRSMDQLDIPLGPEIGQCCGGRVTLGFALLDAAKRENARAQSERDITNQPHFYIMGAGHVGRALAGLSQYLPLRCILIDSRVEQLALCAAEVETRASALPESDIQSAPAGSAFVITTHDHGLDFLLTAQALMRGDAAYVGLIGSATKRAKFMNWCRDMGHDCAFEDLICPIGAASAGDKRPSVIAAFVVAEILSALSRDAILRKQIL